MKTGSLESRLKIPRPTRKSTNHIVTRWEKQGRVSRGGDVGDVPRTGNVRKCTVPGKPCCGAISRPCDWHNGRCDFTRDREGALFSADRIGHRENVLTDNLSLLFHTRQVGRVVQRNHIYS